MDLDLLDRQAPVLCAPGYESYHCHIAGTNQIFVGCCAIDPCNNTNIGCPPADFGNSLPVSTTSPSAAAAAAPSAAPSGIITFSGLWPVNTVVVTSGTSTMTETVYQTFPPSSTADSGETAAVTSSSTPSSTLSSLSTSTIQAVTTSLVLNPMSMSLSSSSQSPTQTAIPAIVTSHANNTPVIAGSAAGGVVALAFLSVLAWFCFRRHQRKKGDIENARDSIAKYGLPTRDYVLERAHTDETMRSKNSDIFAQFGGRSTTPKLSHSVTGPNQENQKSIAAAIIRSHPAQRVLDSPTDENAPLPDFEKSSVTPPPAHEHPAFHPLPGERDSSKVSTYQPKGQPIHFPSSSMTQHPAYHLSQLNQHPAFRSSSGSRKEAYMRREAGSMLSEIPVPFSPAFSSPLPGFTELPAEVPVSYRTSFPPAKAPGSYRTPPAEVPGSGSWPLPNTTPAGTNGNNAQEVPIGLAISQNGKTNAPVPLPLPQFKVHHPNPSSSTSNDDYQIKIFNVPQSKSTNRGKQVQLQTYDGAYDYDDVDLDVSPVGSSPNGRWSGSTIGELDRLDVEVGDKREVVDELTPLSQVYRESWSERESWCAR